MLHFEYSILNITVKLWQFISIKFCKLLQDNLFLFFFTDEIYLSKFLALIDLRLSSHYLHQKISSHCFYQNKLLLIVLLGNNINTKLKQFECYYHNYYTFK